MCHLIAPGQRLAIALGQGCERSACPEGVADIADGSLHATFLIAGADLTGARHKMIVGPQLQESRVEVNLVAPALQNGAAEIVRENHAGLAGPVLKSMHMAAQEVL